MGTGSEQVHDIYREKTPLLGACPHFQRRLGMVRLKKGTGTVAKCGFARFPTKKRRSQSPFSDYRIYSLSYYP